MNIFIFHRDLRIQDNTTLLKQMKEMGDITPIFIFTPQQILPQKNPYYSNNSVQFMIECLFELHNDIKEKNGELYFFYGNTMDVLRSICKNHIIQSIGFNIDYTPFARLRDSEIVQFCNKNHITVFKEEDYLLYDILNGQTLNKSGQPYQVFTSFKNHCRNNLPDVRQPIRFNSNAFHFQKYNYLKDNSYFVSKQEIQRKFVHEEKNNQRLVHGGRKNAIKILQSLAKFRDYNQNRNTMNYQTTHLSAYNHFTPVSIREVYHSVLKKLGNHSLILNELLWRDFYVNVTWYFPHVLEGQTKKTFHNCAFKEQYDKIKWKPNNTYFDKWKRGETGIPIVDAGMRELNQTGYMHNRSRMIQGNFLTKDLHIDWRKGEQYFATQLVDYSPMQNSGGWQWCAGCGTDAQPYFRIFNPYTQAVTYDPKCEYIKKWIPELKDVPNKDILKWEQPNIHNKWIHEENIEYFKPIVNHNEERIITLHRYKEALS